MKTGTRKHCMLWVRKSCRQSARSRFHRVIAGCETIFGMWFRCLPGRDGQCVTVAKHHGVKAFINMSQIQSLR
jgi:hypothetical protein